MDFKRRKKAVEALLLPFLGIFAFVGTASAAPDSLRVETTETSFEQTVTPLIDRIAVRTNAFDWMLTIPNIGFEMDLNGSEYNNITLGLSAKYNWNTLHYNMNTGNTYAPPTAYNLLDIRPEARYWFRTRKGPRTKAAMNLENFLKNRKDPKTWRANYVGVYTNYANYSFKLGQKGMQGHVFGFGLSAGYSVPMYEYSNGAIDVELGASVGLQLCTRDMFAHNPDGYFYVPVVKGTKDLHLTPFPVVSDVRVAFVWRHKSIKDKVKEDVERNRVKRVFNTIESDYNYNDQSKSRYDEDLKNTLSNRDRERIMANDSLYRAGFMKNLNEQEATLRGYVPMQFSDEFKQDPRVYEIVKEYEEKLYKLITQRKKEAIRLFEKEWAQAKSGAAKAKAEAAKAKAEAEKKAKADAPKDAAKEKVEKTPKQEKAPKEAKAQKEKKVKEEKQKKEKAEKE